MLKFQMVLVANQRSDLLRSQYILDLSISLHVLMKWDEIEGTDIGSLHIVYQFKNERD